MPSSSPAPIISAKRVRETLGYRKLSRAELVSLGFSPSSERFTTAPVGSKRLIAKNTISKRSAYQQLAAYYGSEARTLESLSKTRRAQRGGRAHTDAYSALLQRYSDLTGRTKGELRKEKEFRELIRAANAERRTLPKNYKSAAAIEKFRSSERERTKRRLHALMELYPEDKQYKAYLEMYH